MSRRVEVTDAPYVLRLTADELAALDAAIQGLAEDGEEAGEGDAFVTVYQKIRAARKGGAS